VEWERYGKQIEKNKATKLGVSVALAVGAEAHDQNLVTGLVGEDHADGSRQGEQIGQARAQPAGQGETVHANRNRVRSESPPQRKSPPRTRSMSPQGSSELQQVPGGNDYDSDEAATSGELGEWKNRRPRDMHKNNDPPTPGGQATAGPLKKRTADKVLHAALVNFLRDFANADRPEGQRISTNRMSEMATHFINTSLRDEVTGLKGEKGTLHEEVTGLHKEVTGLKGEKGTLHEEVTGLHKEVTGLKGEKGTLHEEVTGLHKEVTADPDGDEDDGVTQWITWLQGNENNVLLDNDGDYIFVRRDEQSDILKAYFVNSSTDQGDLGTLRCGTEVGKFVRAYLPKSPEYWNSVQIIGQPAIIRSIGSTRARLDLLFPS